MSKEVKLIKENKAYTHVVESNGNYYLVDSATINETPRTYCTMVFKCDKEGKTNNLNALYKKEYPCTTEGMIEMFRIHDDLVENLENYINIPKVHDEAYYLRIINQLTNIIAEIGRNNAKLVIEAQELLKEGLD